MLDATDERAGATRGRAVEVALPPMFRMPVGSGPSPGPRQGPDGRPFDEATAKRTTALTVTFESDGDALARLLPPKFELTEPVFTVRAALFTEITWLAGRAYSVLGVYIPAEHVGRVRTRGSYCAVLWENLADPILTGREELGVAKLFADIDIQTGEGDASHTVEASWMGYRFARMELRTTGALSSPAPAAPILNYKYIPRAGAWGTADVEYATMLPVAAASTTFEGGWTAEGSVSFARPAWQDMPTQSHIVSAFADLPQAGIRGAAITKTLGGGDYGDVAILES